jgi:hypothetical protein
MDPLTLAIVSETNMSSFWFNDKRGPTIVGIIAIDVKGLMLS